MKMHVKQGAIITLFLRSGSKYAGRLCYINEDEVVLQPQLLLVEGDEVSPRGYRCEELVRNYTADTTSAPIHINKNEIEGWTYYTIPMDSGTTYYGLTLKKDIPILSLNMYKETNISGSLICEGIGEYIE